MWRVAALASLAWAALAVATPAGTEERLRGATPEPGPDGMLVLAVIPRERAVVADPRTGRTSVRDLPGGTLCHGPLLTVRDRVVYSGSRDRRAVMLSSPLDLSGRARSLGPADTVTPSATPGRLWLGRWTDDDHMAGRLSLREADADGRVFARTSSRLPRWAWLEAHVAGGFLMSRGRGLVLRRPLLDRPLVRIPHAWVVAAGRERFAWCREPCRRVGLWSGGGSQELVPPAGIRPHGGPRGAFSPDGRSLVLPVKVAGELHAAVIELDRGRWTVVPGARLGLYAALAWSPTGRWLYLGGRGRRVLASLGGTERAIRLPIRTRGTVMSIASR